MIGGLIVTHGRLAIELHNAAEMIVGEIHHITAVSLGWHDDVAMATTMIEKALERVKTPDRVLILTDMFGGTPTNIASTFLDQGKVEVVTGVNLPMLMKLAQIGEGTTLASAANLVRSRDRAASTSQASCLRPGSSDEGARGRDWPSSGPACARRCETGSTFDELSVQHRLVSIRFQQPRGSRRAQHPERSVVVGCFRLESQRSRGRCGRGSGFGKHLRIPRRVMSKYEGFRTNHTWCRGFRRRCHRPGSAKL